MSAAQFQNFGPAASSGGKKEGDRAEAGRHEGEVPMNVNTQAREGNKGGRVLPLDLDAVRRVDAVKAAEWFQDRVAAGEKGTFSEVVNLTPGLATVLLANNEKNRPVSETNLDRIKRDLESGNWQFNGATIVVSKDGKLNDGQHRCRAVIETNIPIRIVMVFGVDRESRMTLDQGVARTVGNFLSMHGLANGNQLAAAAALVWQWRRYGRVSNTPQFKPTKTEVRLLAETDSQIAESLGFCKIKGAQVVATASMLTFAHYAIRDAANVIEADNFIRSLVSGAGLKPGSAILYCRNRLVETRSRTDVGERAELIFRAWNAHRRDEWTDRIVVNGRNLPRLEA